MDDRTVTDGHIVADQGRYAFINVNDCAILDIAAFTDPDDSVVSAKHRAEPDAGSRPDFDITDDTRTIGDENAVSNPGALSPRE